MLLSAFAAHSAWHWFTERGAQLLAYRWQAPVLDAAFFAAAMRWSMLLIAMRGRAVGVERAVWKMECPTADRCASTGNGRSMRRDAMS